MTLVLADTSAWTARRRSDAVDKAFVQRARAGQIAGCAMVELELRRNARNAHEHHYLRNAYAGHWQLAMNDDVWARALEVDVLLAQSGPGHHRRVSLPDLLIAATAELADVAVLHYDRDFETIAAVTGQAVETIAPLGSL